MINSQSSVGGHHTKKPDRSSVVGPCDRAFNPQLEFMEIFTASSDVIIIEPDEDERVRFSINNEVTIVMPPMTASLVAREMLETIKQLQKKPRQTKRPK